MVGFIFAWCLAIAFFAVPVGVVGYFVWRGYRAYTRHPAKD